MIKNDLTILFFITAGYNQFKTIAIYLYRIKQTLNYQFRERISQQYLKQCMYFYPEKSGLIMQKSGIQKSEKVLTKWLNPYIKYHPEAQTTTY